MLARAEGACARNQKDERDLRESCGVRVYVGLRATRICLSGKARSSISRRVVSDFGSQQLMPPWPGRGLILRFLADGSTQIDVWTSGPVGHGHGVLLDSFGLLGHEPRKVLDLQALTGYVSFHGVGLSQRQMAFEKDPAESGNRPGDRGPMLVDESFHGVLLSMAA